jgi:predicted Zn-dependent protease with MMP-like domain
LPAPWRWTQITSTRCSAPPTSTSPGWRARGTTTSWRWCTPSAGSRTHARASSPTWSAPSRSRGRWRSTTWAALARADDALKHGAPEDDASYERASALYELCRFDEAAALFSHLVGVKEKQAYARYHLGLIAERKGDTATAARELSAARAIDGADFPAEVPISPKDFDAMIQRQVHALPPDMQQDLATLPLQIQDLPDLADLTANEPPLSPAILGLFRGPALQERCDGAEPGPCRSIVLYRKNLARVTRDPADLEDQVRVTLLHELGHLRGEDDLQLAARGLE